MALKAGDLVRWIVDHEISHDQKTQNSKIRPIYARGIIVDVSSSDSNSVIIACFNNDGLMIRHMLHDGFEVISEG